MHFLKKYWILILVIFGISMFLKPALCALIIGCIAAYIGIESIQHLRTLGKKGIDWNGMIVEIHKDSDGDKTPIVEFTTAGGESIREKPFLHASTDLDKFISHKKLIGQSVPILYNPDDPKQFIIKNGKESNYLFSVILLLAGLFFIGLSITILLGYIKMS